MHSNAGSGHRAHGGQGGHFLLSLLEELPQFTLGQAGQMGGTISDLRIYKSSCPFGILFLGIPSCLSSSFSTKSVGGFFFGDTEYDVYYFWNIKDTRKQLKKIFSKIHRKKIII